MSAPTGQIQGGNFVAPHPFNAGSGSMQRNWGATTSPPQQDSTLAQGINAWMMNPANRNNYYNYRAGSSGRSGRGFWGRNKQQQQQQPQGPTTDSSITLNFDQSGVTFGSQENLARGDFGGGAPGMQFQQPAGQPPAGQNPRQRQPLTQEQKDRRNATARANRALKSDIAKNGTPDQKQRIQTQGVAGGKTRQPRQPKTAAQTPPSNQPPAQAGTMTATTANVVSAPQTFAPQTNFGAPAQSTAGSPGAPLFSMGSITGGTATAGPASAKGGTIGKTNIF
jgi:hypothetical protein